MSALNPQSTPRIGVRIYTNFGPVHGGPLNNGGRVRIVSGDPLARFELLSPLFNANLKPGTGILAPVSGFRHRLESPVSSLAAAMAG